jgi:hypothetical protein
MPNARRLGLFLLLIACAPLIIAAGGGPGEPEISGVTFEDVNKNGVQDPEEPGLGGWTIYLFDTETKACSDRTPRVRKVCTYPPLTFQRHH